MKEELPTCQDNQGIPSWIVEEQKKHLICKNRDGMGVLCPYRCVNDIHVPIK
jgi:hypothetical protein